MDDTIAAAVATALKKQKEGQGAAGFLASGTPSDGRSGSRRESFDPEFALISATAEPSTHSMGWYIDSGAAIDMSHEVHLFLSYKQVNPDD